MGIDAGRVVARRPLITRFLVASVSVGAAFFSAAAREKIFDAVGEGWILLGSVVGRAVNHFECCLKLSADKE